MLTGTKNRRNDDSKNLNVIKLKQNRFRHNERFTPRISQDKFSDLRVAAKEGVVATIDSLQFPRQLAESWEFFNSATVSIINQQ